MPIPNLPYTVTATAGSAAVVSGSAAMPPMLREYLEMRRRALYQELRWIEREMGIAPKG